MKIAINTLGPSKLKAGIGNYIVNLVNQLQRVDKSNEYLIFVGEENQKFFNKTINFQFYNIGFFNKNRFFRIIWEQIYLPFILKRKKINLLHSPGFVSPILKTTKQVVTIHDMTFFTHPQFHLKLKIRYFQNIVPISVKRSDMVISDSENTKKDIISFLKTEPSKIKTIHLGTDFKFRKNAKLKIMRKYGISGPFILYVGLIEPRKNILNLIRAYAKISPKIKHRLVIVGKKGWEYKEIFELVENFQLTGKIKFTDYVPDKYLECFYSAADLFIYPSYYEGFGIPVIEAMACGCPVITSENSSLKEIAGNAAILIKKPNNIDEIAGKMQKILKNKKLQLKLRQKGLLKSKELNWKKTAEKTLELYESI